MTRKALTVPAALLLGLTFLPALPASAAVSAATLTAGVNVLPGATSYSVDVRNTNPSLIGGRRIDLVLFTLPSNVGVKTSSTSIIPPTGWEAIRTNAGSVQTYQFRTKTAQAAEGIAPGASLRFTFPADVARPVSADRTGTFKVTSSDDYGQTVDAATGALDTTVRVLEVVEGSLKGVAPLGVTDGSGTAGQAITYGMTVRNHSQSALAVTPALSSPNDKVDSPSPAPGSTGAVVPALGGTTAFTFPVTLGGSVDRTSTFTSSATATGASSLSRNAAFEVQAPGDYTPNLATLQPRIVRKDRSYTFSIEAAKVGKPAFTELTGSFSFAGTTTELLSRTAAKNADGTLKPGVDLLTYKSTTVNPADADGRYNATLTFNGVDGNGYRFPTITKSLANAVTIDNKLPLPSVNVQLPSDPSDGKQQVAAKNADRITVSGSLDQGATDCTDIVLKSVNLRQSDGTVVPVDVTRNGCSYSGSVTPTFAAAATSFVVDTNVIDGAENPGFAQSGDTAIDNQAPIFNYAKSLSPRRITVEFKENLGLVRGGCAPQQWEVDGEPIITSVLYSDGTPCTYTPGSVSAAGKDNTRILVLSRDRDQDFQANITYRPGAFPAADPVKDGANAAAGLNKVLSDVGINPTAPAILAVTRAGGTETATFDEGKYFTRFSQTTGPNGAVVDDLQVSFANGRAGYKVQVQNAAGATLSEVAVGGSPSTVRIPLGTTDGDYVRRLVLVNGSNLLSAPTTFTVVLDRLKPAIAKADLRSTGNQIDVTFSEKLATGGSESPVNWFGKAKDPQADQNDPDQVNRVSPATRVEGSGGSRLLTLADSFAGLTFSGAEYILQSPDGKRYPDRAGNLLQDTTTRVS